MTPTTNPLLLRVIHRRRLRRRARLAGACWLFLGGLHIAVWWAAYDHGRTGLPEGALDAAVWPLLFASTISFVVFAYYTARWFLAPSTPKNYDWLEPAATELFVTDLDEDTEPTIIRTRLAS
ncbi:hypothetical protein FOE78_21365 [Microlunatus elymi]|uniref:Uncharacterized protein n=1 Tax=Microlunatus elymi TaxID=2596828 RepID=A0A516Q3U2_9ACTN|nr:hypothetical protein [Microlunatus elymi]QDP98108.1 hypothetical protein FOE78_21365 [Microlunatus elymi]